MNYLHYLEKEIHSVIMATVDDSWAARYLCYRHYG